MNDSSNHRSSIIVSSTLRKCIVSGVEKPKEEMIRFVVGPAGEAVPDIAEKLPGRGIWISATREAVDEAVKKNLLARSAKQKVASPGSLSDRVEELLKKRILELLSLSNKSGALVTGFAKVMEALTSGKTGIWLEAADGGDADFEKLSRLPHGLTPFRLFAREELGIPTGRSDAVHVAVLTSGIATTIVKEMRRFAGFRKTDTL